MPIKTGPVSPGVAAKGTAIQDGQLGRWRGAGRATGLQASGSSFNASFVQAQGFYNTTASIVVTPTTPPAPGNLAVIFGFTPGGPFTPPSGWTQILTDNQTGANYLQAWYHQVAAGESSYTFTIPLAQASQMLYAEYSATTHTPVAGDAITFQYPTAVSGTMYNSGATGAGRFFVSFFALGAQLTAMTTTYANTSGVTNAYSDETHTTAGAYADTGTITASPMNTTWTYTHGGSPPVMTGLILQVY
jgi:hypothetical protein